MSPSDTTWSLILLPDNLMLFVTRRSKMAKTAKKPAKVAKKSAAKPVSKKLTHSEAVQGSNLATGTVAEKAATQAERDGVKAVAKSMTTKDLKWQPF
jgi:hypothetical protein